MCGLGQNKPQRQGLPRLGLQSLPRSTPAFLFLGLTDSRPHRLTGFTSSMSRGSFSFLSRYTA